MPEFIRVKDKTSKHEFSIVASAFDEEAYTRLDKPATKPDGTPLPAKHHLSLSTKDSAPESSTTGRKASRKEGAS